MKRMNMSLPILVGVFVLAGAAILLTAVSVAKSDSIIDSEKQLEECVEDCNEAYGGWGPFPPPLSHDQAIGWANCRLKCERRYWKKFDKDDQKDKQKDDKKDSQDDD